MTQITLEEFRARHRAFCEEERSQWRQHWRTLIPMRIYEFCGNVAFGLCLGLAIDLQLLVWLLKNY